MKKSLTTSLLLTAIALGSTISTSASAIESVEGLSANVGVVSQYFFRGIVQTDSASAHAGLDYELGNFTVGTWIGDVGDGLEVDLYGAYNLETDSGLGLSASLATYQYTGDFDSEFNEISLGLSYSFLSIAYYVGKHGEDLDLPTPQYEYDYDFLSITAEYEGLYATYGTWGDEADGDFVELGYGATVSNFDVGVAFIINSEELDFETGDGDESLVFSVSTSF